MRQILYVPDATYPFIFILVIDGEGRHAEQLRDARIDSAQYARVQLQSSIKVHGVSLYKGARRSRGNAKKIECALVEENAAVS